MNVIDLFCISYANVQNKNHFLHRIKYYSVLRFTIRIIANIFLPVYLECTKFRNIYKITESNKKEGRVVVSFTSFPMRINRLWLVVETLLHQTCKPDIIELYLSKKQFKTLELLPKRLLKQRDRGLEIFLEDDDLRSHKKYYYALHKYKRDILITIDDDIFYPTTMIQMLLNCHIKYSHSVICCYGTRIQRLENGNLLPYSSWKTVEMTVPSFDIFFGSGGGTLFPIGSLYKDVLRKDLFMDLCPYADDIWLNAMSRLAGFSIVRIDKENPLLPVLNVRDTKLHSINISQRMNDNQLNNVRDYYSRNEYIDPFVI